MGHAVIFATRQVIIGIGQVLIRDIADRDHNGLRLPGNAECHFFGKVC